uniref:DNA replication ATP-dependent helicase/nuclease n=1 Tax=Anopheles epiroticus TaxID=199890 RepID=A0A182PVN6_9DIPT
MKRSYSPNTPDSELSTKHKKVCESNASHNEYAMHKLCDDNETNSEIFMNLDDEWPDMDPNSEQKHYTLDLSTWKRCRVLTIQHIEKGCMHLTLQDTGSKKQAMLVGTVAHCIFQRCILDKNCKTLIDVQKVAENVMKTRKVVSALYTIQVSIEETYALLQPYLKQIEIFLNEHVHQQLEHSSSKNQTTEKILIRDIHDIEENIWCHNLGIKGRIDATVAVACDTASKTYEIMPLELKTGRASYSFEHLGQLALYEMMMNLVGHDVSAGLLLYLRDGKFSRVTANRNMKRDLILLRNEVTSSLSRWMVMNENDNVRKEESFPLKPTLPNPINNERACVKCSYNTVCTAFYKKEQECSINTSNGGFSSVAEEACGHLRNSDIDYLIQWTGLIYLELQESVHCKYILLLRNRFLQLNYTLHFILTRFTANMQQHIWNSTPKDRSEKGKCIFGLCLITPVRIVEDLYFHTFKFDQSSVNVESSGLNTLAEGLDTFEVGEYVICSTTKRIAVASGHIIGHAGHELVVSFERDLAKNYNGESFILDQSASYSSISFSLSNLALLLENDERCARYRRIIVDREKPTFFDGIFEKSMIAEAKEILKNLNRHQKIAALKAAATESYFLLKGLPGTGKTQTIVGLIRLLSFLGQSILLTSNTHSAVDNVLKRLLPFQDLKFIRLGSIDRVDPTLSSFVEANLTENCDDPEKLAELYNQFNIVAVTCQGTGHPLINRRIFDYCIVDEATQVFQTNLIRPLLRCKRFLLVGDPEQLPPVVKSDAARSLGATESMFHRLDQEGSFYILPTQYRMNRVLTKLANNFTYNGKLICGNDVVENSTLSLPNFNNVRMIYEVERWLMKTISNQIDLSAVFVNTGNTFKKNQEYQKLNAVSASNTESGLDKSLMKCTNVSEIAMVVYICHGLLQAGVKPTSIGIIAPFRAQVDVIRKKLENLLLKHNPTDATHVSYNIEVNTIDQYQGKDKNVIILSCTKSTNLPDFGTATGNGEQHNVNDNGILSDKRRLTVAITRAKQKLIVIGDRSTLEVYAPFKQLFSVTSKISVINVVDKKDGFEWNSLIEFLNSLSE